MKFIPFSNLRLQQERLGATIQTAVSEVINSGWYLLGNKLSEFEKQFAYYNGNNYCAGVASGTDAITLSLLALGILPGDEVITTDLTAYPTITGIVNAQAKPVPVDIDCATGLIDSSKIELSITSKTKAIVIVHLYGQCCDMETIVALCKKHDLYLVEDCAQAVGALYYGKKAGTFGHCSAFSFYPTKNLGALGDAGAVVTDSEDLYTKITELRNYGQKNRYIHDSHGINSRLDEIQAAILLVKLQQLDSWNKRRNEIALQYRSRLSSVQCLRQEPYNYHNYHLFVIRHRQRDQLAKHLSENGVQTLIHYPVPVHCQKAFPYKINKPIINAVDFADTILSLPLYPELSDSEIEYIISTINSFESKITC
jgi:dTDP-4-amino-4,6-dideoxygalactose transaminase